VCGRFALSDDFRSSLDFFLGDSDMDFVRATAARVWTCDSEKLRDNMTTGLCGGTGRVSAVQVDGWQESAGHGHAMEEQPGAGRPNRTVMSGGLMTKRPLS
jgi:hypothetical protein